MKKIKVVRTICFVLVLLTSIPLLDSYLRGAEFRFEIIVHLHAWLGAAFFVIAIINMLKKRKIDTCLNKFVVKSKLRTKGNI